MTKIKAITIFFDKLTSKEKHDLIHNNAVKGICFRRTRNETFTTVFMVNNIDVLGFVLKQEHIYDIITVPFIPKYCADRTQIGYCYWDERAKSYSMMFSEMF